MVTQRGMPRDVVRVATSKAPKPGLPKRLGRLRLFRPSSTVVAAGTHPPGSVKTIAYARVSDGRRLTFDLSRRCTVVRVRGVRRDVLVTVQAYGLPQDMEGGRVATVTLKSKRVRVGGKGKLPRHVCR